MLLHRPKFYSKPYEDQSIALVFTAAQYGTLKVYVSFFVDVLFLSSTIIRAKCFFNIVILERKPSIWVVWKATVLLTIPFTRTYN